MIKFPYMGEMRRNPEQRTNQALEKALDYFAQEAMKIRGKHTTDGGAAAVVMNRSAFNKDPNRSTYFKEIVERMRKFRTEPQPAQEIPPPQPPRLVEQPKSALKDSMSIKAWKDMIADAEKHEKAQPDDAYDKDDEAA